MAKSLTKAQLGELKGVLSGELSRLTSNARHMITHRVHEPDELPADTIDVSTEESLAATENRLRDREKFLLRKIEKALATMEEGEYGLCEECADPIGYARLKARPVATLCIDCKEEQERNEGKVADRRNREEDDSYSIIF